jgi:multiple sugar transport system substrate-binding protein
MKAREGSNSLFVSSLGTETRQEEKVKKGLALLLVALFAVANAQDASWWTTAAEPYEGVTIRGVSESTPPSNYVKDVLAPQFTELTGINVEFETTSWDQMYDKAIKDMEANTGIYDFVYIEQDIIYSYLARDFLVDIDSALAENASLKASDVDFSHFTTFANYFKNDAGDLFGVPMEAFIKVYLYRKDLFEDPAIQAAYKEQYGKDLAPATTFEDYRNIAEFFTKYGQDNGMELWGTTVQGSTGHPASTYEFLESIGPSFGLYNWGIVNTGTDDAPNYKATSADGGGLDGEAAKAALSFWIDLLQFAPPESTSSTWSEVATTFAAGRAAQGWVYGENAAWIATDADQSNVVGKVGVALPPTADGVIAAAEAGEGYIGYYDGGAFGIPHSSKNKEAALLFLQFIAQDSVQPDWAVAAPRITHTATFDDPKVVEMDAKVDGYYTLLKEQGKLFAGAPAFPFHAAVRETIDPFVHRALAGEITPEEALDQAAVAVNAKLVELGYAQ